MSGVLCVMIVIVAYSDCCGGAGSECFNITEQVFPDCFYPLLQFCLTTILTSMTVASNFCFACSLFKQIQENDVPSWKNNEVLWQDFVSWIYGQYLLAGLRWLTTELGRPTRQTWSNQNSSLPPTANHSALNIVRQAARTTSKYLKELKL